MCVAVLISSYIIASAQSEADSNRGTLRDVVVVSVVVTPSTPSPPLSGGKLVLDHQRRYAPGAGYIYNYARG